MQSKILHVPTGIVLDLSEPDLGHPDGRAIIESHYHDCHRDRPAFECMKHRGGTNPGMYLKKIRGEWWAVHFETGPCHGLRLPAPMSDEHKRQAEYWVRAAQDAGWQAETEHTLASGTRPDVLIHGPVVTGIEVQRSSMTRVGAVQRTKKAAQAGVCDVWFTDKGSTLRPEMAGMPAPPGVACVGVPGAYGRAGAPIVAVPPPAQGRARQRFAGIQSH
jgi:hypothetical protein